MRHAPRSVTLLLTLGLFLAGCVTPTDDEQGSNGGGDPKAEAGRYQAWTRTDYWVYDMDVRGFSRFSDVRLVYYMDIGDEYTVGTPDYQEALYHAVFSVNPILGRVHQGLLSPHERGEHAHMYPFHVGNTIHDGQQWTTNFYAHFLGLTATYSDKVPAPGGARPGYLIRGEDPNADFTVTYNYVRDVKWFTELKVVDEEGTLFHLVLKETGTGHKGPAHFIRAKDYLHETVSSEGNVLSATRTFSVSAKDVDDGRAESFAISADIQLRSGLSATLRLRDPAGTVVWERDYDDPQSGETNIVEVWPTGAKSRAALGDRPQWRTGTYTVEFAFSGQATAEVHIVGTQDNSGVA